MMKEAFLFPGQGAQYSGMMADFDRTYPACHDLFVEADDVLHRSISGLCFHGSEEDLALTHNTQPCTFVCDLVVAKAMEINGIGPSGTAGFSLGEYAALVQAGVLPFSVALPLVQFRADAMQRACPEGTGAMAAVKECPEDLVEEICAAIRKTGGKVWPTNYNSPKQIVVSGEAGAVEEAVRACKARKYRAVAIPVSAPFHTPLLEPARKELEAYLAPIPFRDASLPLWQNIDGRQHRSAPDIKRNLIDQATHPVRWMQTIRSMREEGFDTFSELGPGHTLTAFAKAILQGDPQATWRTMGTVEAF